MLLVYFTPTLYARPLSLSTVLFVSVPPQINLGHVTPTRKPTRLSLHAAQSGHVFEDFLRGSPLHVDFSFNRK